MFDADLIARLIGREHRYDPTTAWQWRGQTVMVTGAGGFIGSHLVAQLIARGAERVVAVEHSEFNLYEVHRRFPDKVVPVLASYGDGSLMLRLIDAFSIKVVFHAGAYKHVPLVEYSPVPAVQNNVLAARQLFRSIPKDVNVVVVSTDKAVNPTNIMGATKRVVEQMALQRDATRVVRFGNVLWSTGSVIPLFYEQIKAGKPITLTHRDVTRYFMTVQEAVDLTLYSALLPAGIYAFDMGEQVRIGMIARRLHSLMGDKAASSHYREEIVGLRPGEKLYEELTLGEGLTDTQHPKIKRASELLITQDDFEQQVERLAMLCAMHDVGALRLQLQKLVPSYDPSCGIVDPLWQRINLSKAAELDDCYKVPVA